MADEPIVDNTDDTDEAVELASLAVDDGKGGKVVPLSALIGSKKELKTLRARNRELEPIAARATEIDGKLAQAQPIIDAILTNPELRAQALRAVDGTATSRGTTEQPTNDEQASSFAETMGLYLADGHTPDVARGRRALNTVSAMNRTQTEEIVRPYATVTLDEKGSANMRAAFAKTDDDGVPWASRESIEEVAKQLPSNLKADPNVVNLILRAAVGLDKEHGRRPKAPDEPLYMAPAGGRRTRDAVVDADMKDVLARVGLTEDEFKATSKKIDNAGGKSVVLGR